MPMVHPNAIGYAAEYDSNLCDGHFMSGIGSKLSCALLLTLAAACTPAPIADNGRFLVYFDEFSANLTPEARGVIAGAVRRVRETNSRAVRIEARASATGSPTANQRLAETRSQVIADELARDGISPAMLRQVPIGQTGSGDPSVAERRVDVVLEQ
jgi:outer membrane protein OmpA-like peptidoglycan-associated protein